jgi:hypothetical protein
MYKMPVQEAWDKGEALPKEIPTAKEMCDL